jgi:hypothetical protein
MNSKVFTHVAMFLMLKVTFGPNFKTLKKFNGNFAPISRLIFLDL